MTRTFPYSRAHRLTHVKQFEAVYDAKVRASRGPLTVFAIPNVLPHSRLGLSVPRRVGTAPKRNRIKRLLREAFRTTQADWPAAYDIVVNVRPHETLALSDYQRDLGEMLAKVHRQWENTKPPGGSLVNGDRRGT